ncbi:MAG: sulfatase/phosphatase domain-containing protein [Kiritimatiellales bacterium]
MSSFDPGFCLGGHGWLNKRFMYGKSFHTQFLMKWPSIRLRANRMDRSNKREISTFDKIL